MLCVFLDQPEIRSSGFTDTNITTSSVTVKWQQLQNDFSADVYQYYSYHIQYKQSGSTTWTTGAIIPYDPDESPQTTIVNLKPNTEYNIRVVAIRTVGGKTDEDEEPDHTNTKTVTTLKVKGNVMITILIVFIQVKRWVLPLDNFI